MLTEEAREGNLDVIGRPLEIEEGFLRRGGETLGLLNFELELTHGGSVPHVT